MEDKKKDLVVRARWTAAELRDAARELERSAVQCRYDAIEELLADFEAVDSDERTA
jgi:5'-deoxynucleotidase YfbR-like HD superfamily hydrolase